MIPLGDGSRRASAFVCWALVLSNAAVFVMMGQGGSEVFERRTLEYAAVPANVLGGDVAWARVAVWPDVSRPGIVIVPVPRDATYEERARVIREFLEANDLAALRRGAGRIPFQVVEPEVPAWLTLLTSMFMHGGWMHLIGNMVFLFAFGPRLEGSLGKTSFLGFYLLTGLLAGMSHVLSDMDSTIPVVGASGAISGLLGGYVRLWPSSRITTLVPLWPFMQIMAIPAILFVAFWVFMQLFLVFASQEGGGGVAVWAHLGGFVYGLLLIRLFLPRRPVPEPRRSFVPVAPMARDPWA